MMTLRKKKWIQRKRKKRKLRSQHTKEPRRLKVQAAREDPKEAPKATQLNASNSKTPN